MKAAHYYRQLDDLAVECQLCPQRCVIHNHKTGTCGVRRNEHGELFADNYGLCTAINLDPIEKKPLYHFFPGSKILSIGSIGCNLHCNFCQNYQIARATVKTHPEGIIEEPAELVYLAIETEHNLGLAFTYNEPTVYYEFMLDSATIGKEYGLQTVMVTNGYINEGPLSQLLQVIDAFNVDLKGFTDGFYRKMTGGGLSPVLKTLSTIRKAGRHLEITFLLIPGKNDDPATYKLMLEWVAGELGRESILHISRYFPAYKSKIPSTPLKTLLLFFEMACKYLDYVYLGNITGSDSQNTMCPQCGRIVISRDGYRIMKSGIDQNGKCIYCNKQIVIS